MNEWLTTSINELISEGSGSIKTGPFGTALKASEYSTEGVPVISVGEVGYGELRLRPATPRVDRGVTSRLPEYVLRAGDIVFGRKGAVDRSAWVKPEQEGWFLGSDGIRLRLPASVDSRFISYQMTSPTIRDWLLKHASGSTMLSLNQKTLGRVSLVLPPLTEQRAIADILCAFDDKISANTRLANLSFELSRAHYAEAKTRASGHGQLGSIANTVLGGTPSRARPELWADGTVPWLNSGKANEERIVDPSALITVDALAESATKLMPVGATVIAITGATLGQVARLEIEACGNQSLVGVWSESGAQTDWLHFAIRDGIPDLLKKATGAAQQHVNKRDVDSLVVPLLSEVELIEFHARVGPLLQAAGCADQGSKTLALLRDTLLPELMSGRLRVKDVEKKIEEVV